MSRHHVIHELERRARETLSDWPKEWQGYHWPGYTLQHTYRVRNLALYVGGLESADAFILEAAALLHDIAKPLGDDHAAAGARESRKILTELGVGAHELSRICSAVETHVGLARAHDPIENRILADADYIDANFGLIAVWRYITIRGHRRDPLDTQVREMKSWLEKRSAAVNQLTTREGREIAAARYGRMVIFCGRLGEEREAGQVGASTLLWRAFTKDAQNGKQPDVAPAIREIGSALAPAAEVEIRTFASEITLEIQGQL